MSRTNDTTPVENVVRETHVYQRRFFILAMFVILSASNAMHWIEYSIIAHIIVYFYSISFMLVDWTSMIYMFSYIILIIPASWVVDRYGLRVSILLGAAGNCLGAWIKVFSARPDAFWLSFIGQAIVGSSQVFILGIPSRLAAVWFSAEQVSTACAVGVFGNQLGIAAGFLIPPLLVRMGTVESIASQLKSLFLISGILNSVIFLLICMFFSKKPPLPPSIAQMRTLVETGQPESSFLNSLKQALTNVNYVILLITYGLNVGVFYAVSTLLNQVILHYYPDKQESTGTIGLLIVLSGMAGSLVCGIILDRFNQYKLTTTMIYFLSSIGMIIFTFVLDNGQILYIYLIAAALGFFMTGYLPIGFEFAAELTYPISEGTTSGLLNASAQIFGIILTASMGFVIHKISVFACNIGLSVVLILGTLLTAMIKSDLRRQKAHRDVLYSTTNNKPPEE